MSRAMSSLSSSISSVLQLQRERSAEAELCDFMALRRAGGDLARRFEQGRKAVVPTLQKRIQALRKLRDGRLLGNSDRKAVFAGLSDPWDTSPPALDDDLLWASVNELISERVEDGLLTRSEWLALCSSYFSYRSRAPENNAKWRKLREGILRGFDAIKHHAGREKSWMRVVEHHRELFGDEAGQQLATEFFEGRTRDLSSLRAVAQIPDKSWLWPRIFKIMRMRIERLDEDTFVRRLPELLELRKLSTDFLNDVLGACLKRYHQSRYRNQSSALLKQTALEHWGSPQISSKHSVWLQYVEQPVRAMVVAWFAKDDLEHFFTLLKGEAEVDQSRLFYWLRFANQMSYTRIVMGGDAWHDRSSDFMAFREKNKGRLSQLTGGTSSNNAVVMQIGNYFFVEFSGTGNACYVYRDDKLPFNPDQKVLELNKELKQKGHNPAPMRHSPAPGRPNLVEGWLDKFDTQLRALGIVPQLPGYSSASLKAPAVESLEIQLAAALGSVQHQIFDNRSKGGTYQVKMARDDARAKTAMLRLGFKPVNNNPLLFWRS